MVKIRRFYRISDAWMWDFARIPARGVFSSHGLGRSSLRAKRFSVRSVDIIYRCNLMVPWPLHHSLRPLNFRESANSHAFVFRVRKPCAHSVRHYWLQRATTWGLELVLPGLRAGSRILLFGRPMRFFSQLFF